MKTILARFLAMAAFWLVLSGNDPGAWIPGALVCAVAAALSARLLPPRPGGGMRLRPALALVLLFARGSVLGGVDVARRALHPRLPVQPGWVRHPLRLQGPESMLLGDIVSLLPGTLAAGGDGSHLLVHCLDERQPVAFDVERIERRLEAALGRGDDD